MTTLTISHDGKITLTKELLDHLGISPGERIKVTQLPSSELEFRAARRKANDHSEQKAPGHEPGLDRGD